MVDEDRSHGREGQASPTEREGVTVDAPSMQGALAPGAELGGRYRIVCRVGAGGMGEVWRAFDLKLRVEVALKALREDLFQEERHRELLRQEVRAAREVVSPNVCRIFDLIEADGRELVSMEYVDGQTLLAVLQERGPLELKEAQDIASQFLAGLEAIHKAGLVHRDVKPENIMITRAGRVVLMDFGLARQEAAGGGTVSGTPAYMAPEQAAGLPVDARADVYSAGVVLAEMVCPEGVRSIQSRQSVWEGIRHEPARVPDTPWAPVLKKAVAKEREARYHSAHTLTRALEDVTLRVEGAEDLHPYPGLSSFTEADAEYFFGREAEVEQMWAKLEGPARLLGLVGPSGAGKTSFLQAGLIPSARAGWGVLRCTPGNSPMSALREALVSQISGDTEAVKDLVRTDDPAATVSAAARWRRPLDRALLIVDQFEELFTLNAEATQASFAGLAARLPLEADVHVLLSMRDDFLMLCNRHEGLRPVVHGLTLLDPPSGAALRRALTQPALQCGYRFEDDVLVEEMLGEVEGERGALPLLAFAAARLWEKRDRETGSLTRQAYRDIGGVGGALARHAEATMDRIGSERIGIMRELFRNLVTAEGTRAVREWDELLSVFADSQRESAREVLRALVDARLLTTCEVRQEEGEPTRRVEIIHESLLSNWPRLVRWQTQDADAAQLRDQLRQAARTWDEHGRTDDLLWVGSAYREYAVWRERYPGGLTGLEEAFASAMTSLATRRRRRRRAAVAAGFATLLAVLAVVGTLWRRSVQETSRAEASKLLALGQLRLADHPNAALAYAIASLERADNEGARRFAVEALWQGPPALFPSGPNPWSVAWSQDGHWLALGGSEGVELLERDTGAARRLSSSLERTVGFTSDGRWLVTDADEGAPPTKLNLWALPEGRLERTLGHAEASSAVLVADRLLTFAFDKPSPEGQRSRLVRELPLDGTAPRALGTWKTNGLTDWDIDPSASWILSLQRGRLLQQRVDALSAPGRSIGAHEGDARVWVRPWRDRAVTGDSAGEVRIWDVTSARLERTLRSPREAESVALDPRGRFIATAPGIANQASPPWLFLFDLAAPRAAAPAALCPGVNVLNDMQFSPDGSWLATVHNGTVALWNLVGPRSIVLGREKRAMSNVVVTPDGDLLSASSGDGLLRRWQLSSGDAGDVQELLSRPGAVLNIDALDPGGRFVVVSPQFTDEIAVVSLDGSPASSYRLAGPEGVTVFDMGVSLDPGARFLAVRTFAYGHPELNAVRILDLVTGEERILNTHPQDSEQCDEPGSALSGSVAPVWLRDGRLVSDGDGGLRIWDLTSGTSRLLRPCGEIQPRDALWLRATPDSRNILSLEGVTRLEETSSLLVFDLVAHESREITSHGNRLSTMALDATGTILVTGGFDGMVRVGPITGEEPHLLVGHTDFVSGVAVSPDGRWIASGSEDGTIRLWPMPDLSKPPLHTLPHDELLAKLKSLTNLRAVPDPSSDTGWKVEVGPFPGWAEVPTWNP